MSTGDAAAKRGSKAGESRGGRTPPRRRRRSPDEAREEALKAARDILIHGGPDAVTLKAVGQRIGMTHANLIHHFGSAAGLQGELMVSMVRDLTDALDEAVTHVLSEDSTAPRELVDIVFDAFEKGGAGTLAAWIALSHDMTPFEPVREAVQSLVAAIEEKLPPGGELPTTRVKSAVLFIALSAFGDSVIGAFLRHILDREPDAMRKIVSRLLPTFF